MNIASDLNNYLKRRITPYAAISHETVTGETADELACRNDPAVYKMTTYRDGSGTGTARIAYYAKSTDHEKARLQLEEFCRMLDFADVEIRDGLFVSCQPQTLPAFVGEYKIGEFVYACVIPVEFCQQFRQ